MVEKSLIMANAMEILGDNIIISESFYEGAIKIYENDDSEAKFIKNYINNAVKEARKYQDVIDDKKREYDAKYKLWKEQGGSLQKFWERNSRPYHWIGKSEHLIELKVNHYRQKFWYWKKLKE